MLLFGRDVIYIKNNELYDIRCEIIRDIANLFNELKLCNLHEQFYVFCYLLWNGYFSIDKSYVYNSRDILDEDNTIFLGRGCCRHNANLLSNVLREMRITSEEIRVRTSNIKLEKMIDINPKMEFFSEGPNLSKTGYNHKATLAEENNGLFYLDPTMLVECEIVNKRLVCFNGKYKIDKKLFLKSLNHSIMFAFNYLENKKTTISVELLECSYESARNVCQENKLFDDFFEAAHPNYEKIKRLIIARKKH